MAKKRLYSEGDILSVRLSVHALRVDRESEDEARQRLSRILQRLNQQENASDFVRCALEEKIDREEGRHASSFLTPEALGRLVVLGQQALLAQVGQGGVHQVAFASESEEHLTRTPDDGLSTDLEPPEVTKATVPPGFSPRANQGRAKLLAMFDEE